MESRNPRDGICMNKLQHRTALAFFMFSHASFICFRISVRKNKVRKKLDTGVNIHFDISKHKQVLTEYLLSEISP